MNDAGTSLGGVWKSCSGWDPERDICTSESVDSFGAWNLLELEGPWDQNWGD